jgi:hypothetical protein
MQRHTLAHQRELFFILTFSPTTTVRKRKNAARSGGLKARTKESEQGTSIGYIPLPCKTNSTPHHITSHSSFNSSKMIYNMYIFDRHCQCIYYHDWHRGHTAKTAFDPHGHGSNNDPLASQPSGGGGGGSTTTTTTMTDPRQGMNMSLEEEGKLVYGVVYSLRNLVKKLGKR